VIYHTTYCSPCFGPQYGLFTAPPKSRRPRHCLTRGKSRFAPITRRFPKWHPPFHIWRVAYPLAVLPVPPPQPGTSGSSGNTSPLPSLRDVGVMSSSTHQRPAGTWTIGLPRHRPAASRVGHHQRAGDQVKFRWPLHTLPCS